MVDQSGSGMTRSDDESRGVSLWLGVRKAYGINCVVRLSI